jgi:CheY-like chemotaxis protein
MSHLLPLVEAIAPVPANQYPDKPSPGSPRTINACAKSALIVEDAEALSKFLRPFLSEEGYAVRIASNSEEGLRLYRDCAPYGVVFIDYYVPARTGVGSDPTKIQTHGIKLATAIRNINPSQGIIIAAFDFRTAVEVPRPLAAMHIPVIVEMNPSQLRMVLEKIEVDRAIRALTPAEQLRLQHFAKFRIRGLGRAARGRDWEDLLEEALYRTLIGATDTNQGRHWNKKVDLVRHLEQAMRSICSYWKRTFSEQATLLMSELQWHDADGQEYSPIDQLASPEPPADRHLLEEEDEALVFKRLHDDPEATRVLQGWMDGLRKDEIRTKYALDKNRYAAIVKRIRVKLLNVSCSGRNEE